MNNKQRELQFLFPSSAIALRDFAPNCPTCEGESQRIFSVSHFNLSTGSAF
ncbi:hypothetical protein [Halothece sp. PCC 7418]|uniref:hypothetical protein n=1 Tax=Halothece sp. (strain PCC 7418) TaxID=65093 RepID=UPI0002F3B59D|nr:hypothetical protein [Halothece sp. PCC 7418]